MNEPKLRGPDTESTAARLIDALAEQAEPVDEGRFTLDPAAAAAKLATFAYTDRSLFLLPLVEGMIGLGAREVAIDLHFRRLTIRGREIELDDPAASLRELYSYALGFGATAKTGALGRLAIGLDMLLGELGKHPARLYYSMSSDSVVAECRPRAAPELHEGPPDHPNELRIELVQSAWDSAKLFRGALTHLREAVRFSKATLTLAGAPLSGWPRDWFEVLHGEGDGFGFRAGLEQEGEHPSVIELWAAGVLYEVIPGEGRAFTAAVELTNPRRDLSQMQFVRDEAVGRALAAVERARLEALEGLARADADWSVETRPSSWPPDRVDQIIGRPIRDQDHASPAKQQARRPRSRPWIFNAIIWSMNASFLWMLSWLVMLSGGLYLLYTAWSMESTDLPSGAMPAIGWTLLLSGVGLYWPQRRKAKRMLHVRDHGARSRATITAVEPHERSSGKAWVRWSFADRNGITRTGRSLARLRQEAALWRPGESIHVYYDPNRPDDSVWEADLGPAPARSGPRSRP